MSTEQKKKPARKPKAPAQHPKYAVMITAAIAAIKERGGCSRQKIVKYIGANYKVGDGFEVHVRLAIRRMVQSAALVQTKGTGASGSFKLAKKPVEKKAPKKTQAKKPAAKKQKKTGDKPKKKPTAAQKKKKPSAAQKKKPSTPKKKKPATKKPQTKKSPAKTKKPAAKKGAAKKGGKK